jgi:hypothetical protein
LSSSDSGSRPTAEFTKAEAKARSRTSAHRLFCEITGSWMLAAMKHLETAFYAVTATVLALLGLTGNVMRVGSSIMLKNLE